MKIPNSPQKSQKSPGNDENLQKDPLICSETSKSKILCKIGKDLAESQNSLEMLIISQNPKIFKTSYKF